MKTEPKGKQGQLPYYQGKYTLNSTRFSKKTNRQKGHLHADKRLNLQENVTIVNIYTNRKPCKHINKTDRITRNLSCRFQHTTINNG